MNRTKFSSILLLGALAAISQAVTFNLSSQGSNATLILGADSNGFGALRDWTVNGSDDQLYEQGYFLRINGGNLISIESLFVSATQSQADLVTANYFDSTSGLGFQVRYLLTGSFGNSADFSEVVTVGNAGNQGAVFSLYQYNDFDLAGTFAGDTANVVNSSTIRQQEGAYNVTVGVTRPAVELGTGTPFNVFSAMNTGTGSLAGLGAGTGPGDAAFAFRWTNELAAGSAWQMSANKILTVPEPATMTALGLGFAALLRRRAKK